MNDFKGIKIIMPKRKKHMIKIYDETENDYIGINYDKDISVEDELYEQYVNRMLDLQDLEEKKSMIIEEQEDLLMNKEDLSLYKKQMLRDINNEIGRITKEMNKIEMYRNELINLK